MLRDVWNLAFKTSRSPYAKPQRKKRIVTKTMGKIDCLTVREEAPVKALLETLLRCFCSTASLLDGRRWSRTSMTSGSSSLPNQPMLTSGGNVEGRLGVKRVN